MLPISTQHGLDLITYGIYIVTTSWQGKDNGLIVNAAFQVTAQPPRVAVCVNKASLTHELIRQSRCFAVLPLAQSADLPFIGRFGFRTGRTFDKLAGLEFTRGVTGCPLVKENTLGFIEAEVEQTLDVDTHTLFVGSVRAEASFQIEDPTPMTYAYYHSVIKGKTPLGATHSAH